MQKSAVILTAAVLLIFGMPIVGRAQPGSTNVDHGMFGPRVLGTSLQPKPSRFSNNFQYGPSGTFEGLRANWVLPPVPTQVIVPGTGNLPDIYQAVLAQPPLAVTVVPSPTTVIQPAQLTMPQTLVPAAVLRATMPAAEVAVPPAAQPPTTTPPATTAPATTPPATAAPATAPELPLRRMPGATAAPTGAAPVASAPVSAAAPPQPAGPQSVSPLQTPGGTYTTFRADFSYARPSAERLQSQLTAHLGSSPELQAVSPIQVSVQGQTAILRGTVATSYDRAVAEQLVRMEAGIWKVDNQLKVSPPPVAGKPQQ